MTLLVVIYQHIVIITTTFITWGIFDVQTSFTIPQVLNIDFKN